MITDRHADAAAATPDGRPGWREVVRTAPGLPASDGAGVRLTRVVGTPSLPDLDPFLMLDEFRSDDAGDYLAGFPDHPHRGFETVTYMLAGRMRHADNHGNQGLLRAGSVQWMTAGRGIVHSEMPEQEAGLMWGFQLWINLPAREKMTVPRYQDIAPEAIPELSLGQGDGASRVRVIAGAFGGVRGPVTAAATDPTYLDVHLPLGARFTHELPAGYAAFAYVYEGAALLGAPDAPAAVRRGQIAVFGERGERVGGSAADGQGTRFLLLAGRPLREPVAKYGPFVMNTQGEIRQAILDYQSGRF